jgi:hypothetical protein
MLLATSCWNITANKKKEVFEMKGKKIPDRFTLKAPNGIAFSEFRGYENWQDVAVSQTEDGIKAILENPVMINAYREGVPGNGKPFPEGSMIARIEWSKKKGPASPYFVEVPDALEIGFVHREGFPDTSGWGCAQFLYDPASDTFKPFGSDSSFGKKICYQCHTLVTTKDYIFTDYPRR